MMVMIQMEMVDQATVVWKKTTIYELEDLLLHLMNVNNVSLDTTLMKIKITEKVDVGMVKEQAMRHEMTIILNLVMDAIQTEQKLKIHGCALAGQIPRKTNEHFAILQLGGIQITI